MMWMVDFASQTGECRRYHLMMMWLVVAIPIESEQTMWLVVAIPTVLEQMIRQAAANQTVPAAVASVAVQLVEAVAIRIVVVVAEDSGLAIVLVAVAVLVDFAPATDPGKEDRSLASAIAEFQPSAPGHQPW